MAGFMDFLGGALSAAPQLLQRRRQFDAEQEARKQQQQFQQIQLALQVRDQELQEDDVSREIFKEFIATAGPGATVEHVSPEILATGEKFFPGRLQKPPATLPSTQVQPGAYGQALPAMLEDGGVIVGGGGELGEPVESPSQQLAGVRIVPNTLEEGQLAQIADANRIRTIRNSVLSEMDSGRFWAQPQVKQDQLRQRAAAAGLTIPATFDDWKRQQDYSHAQQLEIVKQQGANARAVVNARATGSGATSGLTPDGLQVAAYQYLQTGQMPPLGMGATGTRTAILNLAGQIASANGINPQAQAALYTADKSALAQLQKSASSLSAFENTAGKNIQVLRNQLAKIIEAGSPALNQPLRSLARYSGDPNIAAFDAARTALVPEISRILSNPNLVGVLSDNARQEGNHILDPNLTVQQFAAVLGVLEQDMLNRKTSLAEELGIVTSRLQGRGAPGAGGPQPPPVAPPGPAPGAPVVGTPQSKYGNVTLLPKQ